MLSSLLRLKNMGVSLTPGQEAFIRQAIESGRFHREEDAVREALSLWEERERKRAEFFGDSRRCQSLSCGWRRAYYHAAIHAGACRGSETARLGSYRRRTTNASPMGAIGVPRGRVAMSRDTARTSACATSGRCRDQGLKLEETPGQGRLLIGLQVTNLPHKGLRI
jgi:Arc/MetJ-type ribon-helix-helix transcriptional regulator